MSDLGSNASVFVSIIDVRSPGLLFRSFIRVCMSVSVGLSNCLLTRAYRETQTIQLGGKAGAGKVIVLVVR